MVVLRDEGRGGGVGEGAEHSIVRIGDVAEPFRVDIASVTILLAEEVSERFPRDRRNPTEDSPGLGSGRGGARVVGAPC